MFRCWQHRYGKSTTYLCLLLLPQANPDSTQHKEQHLRSGIGYHQGSPASRADRLWMRF